MRSLLLLISSAVAGAVIGSGLFMALPTDGENIENLALKIDGLEDEVEELREQSPSLPAYRHWNRFDRYLDTYGRLQVERFSAERVGHPDFGGDQWGGVISGPTLDVLLAARTAQGIVPVYFDRIAIDDDTARMTFYVLGAKEN